MDATEKELWDVYWADRSIANRNKLIEQYLPMVRRIAERKLSDAMRRVGIVIDDLIADALPGLIECIEGYDGGRDVKFLSYAHQRIRGSIQDGLRRMDWVPRAVRSQQRTEGVKPTHMTSYEGMLSRCIDFSGTEYRDQEPLCVAMAATQHRDIEREEWWAKVCRGFHKKERLIVLLYFRCGLTMKQIGVQIGVSESRVSQMTTAVLKRLKERAEELNLDLPVS